MISRDDVRRQAQQIIAGRRLFEEHQLGGHVSEKPLRQMSFDPNDVLQLVPPGSEMYLPIVSERTVNNGTFAVRAACWSEEDAMRLLEEEVERTTGKSLEWERLPWGPEATLGPLRYEVQKVPVHP